MRMQDDYEVEGDLGGGNGIDIVQTANNTEPTEVVGEEMGHRVSAVVPAAGGWRDQRRPGAQQHILFVHIDSYFTLVCAY
jgi:hypothetical protein